jgi:hypothetical protein
MYALARLVAGPAPAARAAFYNAGGLAQLQALMRPSAGASKRVQTKAVNLVTDLIGVWAGSIGLKWLGWAPEQSLRVAPRRCDAHAPRTNCRLCRRAWQNRADGHG